MSKDLKNFEKSFLGILLFCIWDIVNICLKGFVISTLWAWFIVPVFKVPELSIPFAIGIGLLMSYTTAKLTEEDYNINDSKIPMIQRQFSWSFLHLFTLLVGYIVHLFI